MSNKDAFCCDHCGQLVQTIKCSGCGIWICKECRVLTLDSFGVERKRHFCTECEPNAWVTTSSPKRVQ